MSTPSFSARLLACDDRRLWLGLGLAALVLLVVILIFNILSTVVLQRMLERRQA